MVFGGGDSPGRVQQSADMADENSEEDSSNQPAANSDVFDSLQQQLAEDPTEPEISPSPPLNYKRTREKQKHSGYLPQCKRAAPSCSKSSPVTLHIDQLSDAELDGPQAPKFKRRGEAANYETEAEADSSRSNYGDLEAACGADSSEKFGPTEFTRTSENYGDLETGDLAAVGDDSDEEEIVREELIDDEDEDQVEPEPMGDGEMSESANGPRRAHHYAMYFDDSNSAGDEEPFETQDDGNNHEREVAAAANQAVIDDQLHEDLLDGVAQAEREVIDSLMAEENSKRHCSKPILDRQMRGGASLSISSRQPPNSFICGASAAGAAASRMSHMTGSFHSGLRSRAAPLSQQQPPAGLSYHSSPDERSVAFLNHQPPAPASAYGRGVRYSAASVGGNLNFGNVMPNNNNGGAMPGIYQNVQPGLSARRRPIAPVDVAALFDHAGLPPLNVAAVARGVATGSPNNPNPLHNWQATKSCLKDRFSFMFNNEILADVHFLVGRGDQRQRIPAHKFVLSVGSAVFDAMFNGHMAATEPSDIELPDVEPVAFLALLKFLYTDEYTFGPESVMTTLYTAKKYAVPSLENACVDFLKKNLSYDNAFMLLTQARLFDEPQLAALCLEMIDKFTAEAIGAEGFTDIDLETLCVVLERDTLRIREAGLFASVIRWSTEECHRQQKPVTPENQRQVLGRALSLIRFPLMTVEEFAQNAAQLGILTDREVVNLFLYFTVNPKPSVGFFDSPRCSVTGKEQVVNRFQRIEGRWGYSGTPDRIKFTVDRRIFIVGFGLFGSIHGPTEYQVNIQIIHCGTGKVIGSNDTSFQCDGSAGTFRVMFKESVEVSPCVTYIASAMLKGPDSHYGTKGLRRIVHQSAGAGGMVTFQFTYAAGNNNGTSVEDGQIPEIIFYTKATT